MALAVLLLTTAVACGTAEPKPTSTVAAPAPAPAATKPAAAAPAVPTAAPTPTAKSLTLRAPEANPKRGGTLKVGNLADLAHYDLHQCATLACSAPLVPMFDGLVRFDPFEKGFTVVAPDLARSWEVSGDGLTYTFHLRDGVKFHDGTPFSADDVKATYDRIIFPPAGVVSFRKDLLDTVKEIKVIDPLTVQFILKEPRGFLLQAIALTWNTIESKKVLEANTSDLKRAKGRPGTGPFIFVDHKPGEIWRYERNQKYWNAEVPYVDRLEVLHFNRGAPVGAAFLAGQVDIADGLDPESFARANKAKGFVAYEYVPPGIHGLWINQEHKPFNDVRVRKAMNLVLNKAAIIKAMDGVQAATQEGWLVAADPLFPAYWEKAKNQPGWRVPIAEDIAEAKRLMAAAGYADGLKNVDFKTRDVPFQQAWSPVVQALLKQQLNIETKITVSQAAIHYEVMNKGDFDIATQATGMDLTATQVYWPVLFRTGAAQNWSRYSNPEMDALLDKLVRERDEAKVAALVRQGIEILDRDVPTIFWSVSVVQHGWRDYVKGHRFELKAHAYDQMRYETVWLDK